VDRTRNAVSSESLADRVQRMQATLERYADEGDRPPPRSGPAAPIDFEKAKGARKKKTG
jgi:hypothetical protein